MRELWQKNLIQITRVTALEREEARLEGERGPLVASIAQTKGKITETELQILQIDQDMRTEVGKDLAEIRGQDRRAGREARSRPRTSSSASISARRRTAWCTSSLCTRSAASSRPGEPIMLIVPEADALTVEAKIAAAGHRPGSDRTEGGAALLHLQPAHHAGAQRRSEPGLGRRDAGPEDRCELLHGPHRRVRRKSWRGSDGLKLVPGMPVEIFVQTGDRTVISYLTKPLADQIAKAWRER